MLDVKLSSSWVIKGEQLSVVVRHDEALTYKQLQIEIYDAGVLNPSPKLGFGTSPSPIDDKTVKVEIESKHLPCGIYEIRLIRLHDPINSEKNQILDFIPYRDFGRQIFEVVISRDEKHTVEDLLSEVTNRETAIESEFIAPLDITNPASPKMAHEYCTLIFVRDILIGTRIRFKNFELLPTNTGLENKDLLNFVNYFLLSNTSTKIQFEYSVNSANQARNSNPVCVIHFPNLLSSSAEDARDYAIEKVNILLLALSLIRDAAGNVFDAVVINRSNNEAIRYSVTSSYVGNMLTGNLSGESAETLATYLAGLAIDPMNQFLTNLYKEARNDRNPDFQYVRFWQILESLADANNYDPTNPLLDYEGNPMMDGSQLRMCKGSINVVFRLFRDSGIGSTTHTWEKVNVWFAFRNAVAHYGSISRHNELSIPKIKKWAEFGFAEISKTGHDKFLWELKEDAKLLLMRRLVSSKTKV